MSEPLKKDEPVFRLAHAGEASHIIDFINAHFDWKLPLVNRPEWFSYYYCGRSLQFAVAERAGRLLAVVGYILANEAPQPDLWASIWVAVRGENGVGLELMHALPALTHARLVACNNIRAKTCVLYRFLGWTAERLPHYYRLAQRSDYRLAKPAGQPQILPAGGDLALAPVISVEMLAQLGLPPSTHIPQKDLWYLSRRYFSFPHLQYNVWSTTENGNLLAYLVTRTVASSTHGEIPVLRLVDFVGEDVVLPRIGAAIDALLQRTGAEYADCYCAGIPAKTFATAGFSERREGDGTIIPNYLTPPLQENTEYYYFTSQAEHFVLFKADGDQDRPNLPAKE